jgi:hypothetical protein
VAMGCYTPLPAQFPTVRATGATVGPAASTWREWPSQPELAFTGPYLTDPCGAVACISRNGGLLGVAPVSWFSPVFMNEAASFSLACCEGADVGFA